MTIAAALPVQCRSGDAPPITSSFDCDDGRGFALTLVVGEPDAIDLLVAERRVRLPHVPTASGARYAAGGTSV